MSNFANLLNEHMARIGLGTSELARRVGIHRHTLMRWRKGESGRPDCASVQACIAHLHLSEQQVQAFLQAAGCPPSEEDVDGARLSPFVVGRPISDPRQFCGFAPLVKRILKLWGRLPLQNIAIVGGRGSGKTSLLYYLQHTVRKELGEGYHIVLVDFKQNRMRGQATLLKHLLGGLGLTPLSDCTLIQFEELLSHANLHCPTLILLDDIELALDSAELDQNFWWGLRAVQQNYSQGRFAFLMTSRRPPAQVAQDKGKPSPFFNIFGYQAALEGFFAEDIRELAQRSPQPFAADDVEWIIRHSDGIPYRVQEMCMACLLALEEGGVWREQFLSPDLPD